eukprot:gnl/MRDRNA2_/MRDRNA2_12064_c0_seq1.p2 gnl/MRDRNA2_/MRDRNA2_12064_c0~~gnl/MRDRNA2_/MRDRNA2_12064_c0_seq1.p2  ORF type:complete len:111 (+),score=18.24 gnl/MRDRNA2_/MRDRNA2_12064_c0_seq1:42-335(+)
MEPVALEEVLSISLSVSPPLLPDATELRLCMTPAIPVNASPRLLIPRPSVAAASLSLFEPSGDPCGSSADMVPGNLSGGLPLGENPPTSPGMTPRKA